jgi:alpha-amylase/alpha-mannosidase (GH57 family)
LARINLAILWHMHQPQYKDPTSGQYLLPWTRLHALKDYWGMVKILEEFPGVHVTFNFVPLLAEQIEEYASGTFKESWFETAFTPAERLRPEQKREALERAFQINDIALNRWPRFAELASLARSAGAESCVAHWTLGEWRDLQLLSQLAWMDEEYLAKHPVVRDLSMKGRGYTEEDKERLLETQEELLAAVLPIYRQAAARGQIEISTTPYYHPILPLLCDTDIARVSNPHTPLPNPAFRYPADAREQLERARKLHTRVFGKPPVGLWPSEGSVSNQALEIATELGFKWFATDEGVLGRTRNIGFWRDPGGYPENGAQLYTPWTIDLTKGSITGFFRDHYVSDLVGFVYSRMGADAAADDFHRRIRTIGDREPPGETATVSVILDGENAWEYYPESGRDFLRKFYRRIQDDPDIRPMTMSEARAAVPTPPRSNGIFPASWISANFDVWIGHHEDVRAWDLLRDARAVYEREAAKAAAAGMAEQREWWKTRGQRAFESVLAAEGSDWCWWFGPEHGSANDAEFDAIYRKHLTEIYASLGKHPPEALAHPIKRAPERFRKEAPSAMLKVKVDGRDSSYFEWLGAGFYSTDRRGGSMHGRQCALSDLHYGFSDSHFYLRVDPILEAVCEMHDFQLRVTLWESREIRLTFSVEDQRLKQTIVEQGGVCLLKPDTVVSAAYGKILEVGLARELFDLKGQRELLVSVALWRGGLPVDILPLEGMLQIPLGEENFAWSDT